MDILFFAGSKKSSHKLSVFTERKTSGYVLQDLCGYLDIRFCSFYNYFTEAAASALSFFTALNAEICMNI